MSLGLLGKTLPGRRGQRQAFQHGGVTPSAHVMGDGNPEGWGWLGVAGGGQNFEFSFHSETVSHLGMIGIQQWVSQGTYQPLSEVVHEAKLNIFTTCPPPEPLEVQFANAREMRLHARFAPHKAM